VQAVIFTKKAYQTKSIEKKIEISFIFGTFKLIFENHFFNFYKIKTDELGINEPIS
jgi:hypothetical protein